MSNTNITPVSSMYTNAMNANLAMGLTPSGRPHRGGWTAAETAQLIQLREQRTRWRTIGQILDHSPVACRLHMNKINRLRRDTNRRGSQSNAGAVAAQAPDAALATDAVAARLAAVTISEESHAAVETQESAGKTEEQAEKEEESEPKKDDAPMSGYA